MRFLAATFVALLVLGVLGMAVAVVGRVADWSPYGLVMTGALAGWSAGVGMTLFLYVTGEDE